MNENTLVCQFNMFDFNQQIYEVQGNKMVPVGTVSTEELPNAMVNYCLGSNINKIHLYGNEVFVSEITDYMRLILKQTYSLDENEIIMEVN